MFLNRRGFLLGSGASGALVLSGCATVKVGEGCSPLIPVDVEESRIIRAVAGLRPYRSSGFVVRREALGDQALIHNYGHGGAGITLSWGSSRLAADLALAGTEGPIAVIGSGVMGLTTARLLQEAGRKVTIYTAALPADTTSAVAGGQVSPFGHFRDDSVSDAWRGQFAAAMAYSWQRFQRMVGDHYGIRWLPTYDESRNVSFADEWLNAYHPNARSLGGGEHPFLVEHIVRFDTMYVESPRFMAQLASEVLRGGSEIRIRRFEQLTDLATLSEATIVNCTGIGARALIGDQELTPVRGQLVVLQPQDEVRYAFTGDAGYMFPRKDGILLGGTFERGEWDATPQPDAIARILSRHRRLFAGLRCTA
ncbi:FAD-dependent oxidoreductase [Sphingomonas sp. HDW15A]|uniref:FAD-dependent oxidoreductase n=1 Tax=Sphingomonas sp. HDW15A TaxID=2714942 RepID=UPI00140D12D6|nr:FAD-dependent oxidoreductase [Sphingomonas sp. HDW15A]QIK96718.1 FAD-dependent oxidoreductase [Sphingomonas sp. HDW15A]